MGEGAGILILEELEHAQQRAHQYWQKLSAMELIATHTALLPPETEGITISKAMQLALTMRTLLLDKLVILTPMEPATVLNDKTESRAIERIFGDQTHPSKSRLLR